MSPEEQILETIFSSGPNGIKRSEIRRQFNEVDVDGFLEHMITVGDIFTDKKGTSYYCWHKDHYLQNLLNSDPKFRLLYQSLGSLEQSISKSSLHVHDDSKSSTNERIRADDGIVYSNPTRDSEWNGKKAVLIDAEEFKNEFDNAIANYSNSIGWVELLKIRKDLSQRYDLSNEAFYDLTNQIMDKYSEEYELSTGGREGIVVRGLLHGFVRCI
jgi:hypothetical protein